MVQQLYNIRLCIIAAAPRRRRFIQFRIFLSVRIVLAHFILVCTLYFTVIFYLFTYLFFCLLCHVFPDRNRAYIRSTRYVPSVREFIIIHCYGASNFCPGFSRFLEFQFHLEISNIIMHISHTAAAIPVLYSSSVPSGEIAPLAVPVVVV